MKGSYVRNVLMVVGAATLVTLSSIPPANAAMAVIDVSAIRQLVSQVRTLDSQLRTATSHLAQAQREYQSITGSRGMGALLGAEPRNYLPPNWAEMRRVLESASATYGALAGQLQSAVAANEVLTAAELQGMSPEARARVEEARRSAAMLQVMAREALATTSARFASLQALITAIPAATDQKGVLELQARIEAEQGMLQNEQTKLEVLYQAAQAEEWARKQRVREQAIADIGSLRTLPSVGL